GRRLVKMQRLYGWAVERASDQLRADGRHLVRRDVGQAEGRLAIRADIQTDSFIAAGRAGRIESPPEAFPGRGFSDVREGPAWTEELQFQRGVGSRRSAARNLRDDQRRVGLQRERQAFQKYERFDPLSGQGGGLQRQFPA